MLEFRLLWGIGWYYEVVLFYGDGYADADAVLFFQHKTVRKSIQSKVRWPRLTMEGRLCSTTSFAQAVQH